MNDWKKREQERKRARAVKSALLSDVSGRIERLWIASNVDGSGFSAAERKAIAAASHSIRSVIGGWVDRGRR